MCECVLVALVRLSVNDGVGAPQVHAVTQALFEMYDKFRQGLAPEAVHRYLALVCE